MNPAGEAVAGVRGYQSVSDLPETPDLAVVCLPARHVLAGVEEALRAGTRAICVISAGFAEIGEEGRERQDQLLARVRAHGGRLVGPNCLGLAVSALRLNATFGPRALPPGPVAFSQLPESRVSRPRTRAGCGPSRVAAASRRPVASAHLS